MMPKHKAYIEVYNSQLVKALTEISKGFYPGDPATHTLQKCRPRFFCDLNTTVILEITMDMDYPYLINSWSEKWGPSCD